MGWRPSSWWTRSQDRPSASEVSGTPGSVAPAADDAWRDLPALRPTNAAPVQRIAIDDDFRTGLATHGDPRFLQPLAHQVDPSIGGLIDGLALTGLPHVHEGGPDLSVPTRNVPKPAPRVQRQVAWSGDSQLSTVRWELPTPLPEATAQPSAPDGQARSDQQSRADEPEPDRFVSDAPPLVGSPTGAAASVNPPPVPTRAVQRAVAVEPPRRSHVELPVALQRSLTAAIELPSPVEPSPVESGPVETGLVESGLVESGLVESAQLVPEQVEPEQVATAGDSSASSVPQAPMSVPVVHDHRSEALPLAAGPSIQRLESDSVDKFLPTVPVVRRSSADPAPQVQRSVRGGPAVPALQAVARPESTSPIPSPTTPTPFPSAAPVPTPPVVAARADPAVSGVLAAGVPVAEVALPESPPAATEMALPMAVAFDSPPRAVQRQQTGLPPDIDTTSPAPVRLRPASPTATAPVGSAAPLVVARTAAAGLHAPHPGTPPSTSLGVPFVQRRARTEQSSPTPVTAASGAGMSFASMFAAPALQATTAHLTVPRVQRQTFDDVPTAESGSGESGADAEASPDSGSSGAAPSVPSVPTSDASSTVAAPAAAPPAADLDEMARRLYEPLVARLREELWLDRERAGVFGHG